MSINVTASINRKVFLDILGQKVVGESENLANIDRVHDVNVVEILRQVHVVHSVVVGASESRKPMSLERTLLHFFKINNCLRTFLHRRKKC